MSCFQCDCEIPHVCYAGMPNARWGWGDEAMAAYEGAIRHGIRLGAPRSPYGSGFVMTRDDLFAARRPVTAMKKPRRNR